MQKELDIIMDLMKDLQDKMEFSPDDFNQRLGKNKPAVEIVKVGVDPMDPMGGSGDSGDTMGASELADKLAGGGDDSMQGMSAMSDSGDDSSMGDDSGSQMPMDSGDMDDMMSPEERLKSRLLKLRG